MRTILNNFSKTFLPKVYCIYSVILKMLPVCIKGILI